MNPDAKTNVPPPPEQGAMPPDVAVESGKQILINWIIVALGLGGLATVGALLPDFL